MLIRTPKLNFIALGFLISVGFLRTSWAQGDEDGSAEDPIAEEEGTFEEGASVLNVRRRTFTRGSRGPRRSRSHI